MGPVTSSPGGASGDGCGEGALPMALGSPPRMGAMPGWDGRSAGYGGGGGDMEVDGRAGSGASAEVCGRGVRGRGRHNEGGGGASDGFVYACGGDGAGRGRGVQGEKSPKKARCSQSSVSALEGGASGGSGSEGDGREEWEGGRAGNDAAAAGATATAAVTAVGDRDGCSSAASEAQDMESDVLDEDDPTRGLGGFMAYKARRVIHSVADQLAPAAVLVQAWSAEPFPGLPSSPRSGMGSGGSNSDSAFGAKSFPALDPGSSWDVLRACGEGWILGPAWGPLRAILHRMPISAGQGAVGRAWASGCIEVAQDPCLEPGLAHAMQGAHIGSLLAIPVYDARAPCATVCPHGGPPFGAAGCAACARPALVLQVVFTRADSPFLGAVPGQAHAAATKLQYECNVGRLCGMFEGWLTRERLALTRPAVHDADPAEQASNRLTVHPSAGLRCHVVAPPAQAAQTAPGPGASDAPGMVKSPSHMSLGGQDRYSWWEGDGEEHTFSSGDTNS